MTAQEILDLLPGPLPPFGALVVNFDNDAGRGYVEGTFSASGRFSVGMQGTCLEVY